MRSETRIGDRIRQIREELDISISDLARMSGISRGYIHKLESGKSNPSEEVLSAIAKALGVLVSQLTGEIDSTGTESIPVDIPESLKQFAEERDIPIADVIMLSKIEYRGRKPSNVDDWIVLYNVIKGTLSKD